MKRGFLPSLLITAIVIFPALFCGGDLQNPWTDPASSVIRDDRSLTTLPPAVNEFQVYPCSLYVLLPGLSDSIRVVMNSTGGDMVLWKSGSLSAADTAVSLSLSFPAGVQSPLRVYLYRKNGTIDSLVKNIVVQHQTSVTLTGLPSSINENQEYACSLYVFLPGLSDSLAVMIGVSATDKVLWRLSPLSAADTAIGLSIAFPTGVQSPLRVYLYRKNGTIDSLVKAVVIRRPPSISPEAERYSTYVNVPVHPVFSITDPDGDIRSCQIWIDSTTGQAIVPQLTRVSATLATVTCAVSSPSFDSMIVFAQALDSTGNASAFAQCTVFVMDTGKPRLSLLRISPAINDSIVNTLPCSLLVKINDDSPIDSAGYAVNPFIKRPMTMINDTVALAIIADLDSGSNFYEAQAWDRAGNLGTLPVPILYTGSTVYRFTFSNIIDRTINENGKFPSINLDSSISLNPPPVGVPNWKADVAWQIMETKPDSGIKPTLNPTTRVVTFAVPDSEWSGSESFTFIASWNGMATGYAGAIYKINPINDPPVIKWKSSCMKTAFDSLLVFADTCAFDPDNKANTLSWTQDTSRSHYFQLLFLSTIRISKTAEASSGIVIDPIFTLWNRQWKIVPKPGKKFIPIGKDIAWTGTDTLRIFVSDGTLKDTADVIVRVNSTCK